MNFKVWTIARYTLFRNLLDYKTLILFTLLPLLMILMLGKALDSKYTPQDMPKTQVAVFAAEQSELAKGFQSFLQQDEIADLLDVEQAASYEDGKRQVAEGKREAFFYIPPSAQQVQVLSNKQLTVAKSLVESFVMAGQTVEAEAKLGASPQLTPQEQELPSRIEEMPVSTTGKMPRAVDYYAVVDLMMFGMFGSLIACISIVRDRSSNTMVRFQTAPLTPAQYKTGKALGNLATVFAISVADVLASKFLLGANWSGNWAVILGAFLLLAVIVVCFGMWLAERVKSMAVCAMVTWSIAFVFSTLTGGFFKLEPGTIVDQIGRISPSYYAQQAIFNTIYGGSSAQVQSGLLGLAAFALAMAALMIFGGRKQLQ